MQKKKWKIKDKASEQATKRLADDLGIDATLANILASRGINTFDEAKSFFRPQLSDLHDPFLMKDMDKAIARIEQAIKNNEKILVFGDYDVDGTTAVSLVYSFLKSLIPNPQSSIPNPQSQIAYYIPDRYKEGYGISTQGIDFAKENDFKLIIALDCGIKSIDKINYANEKQIDFIWK